MRWTVRCEPPNGQAHTPPTPPARSVTLRRFSPRSRTAALEAAVCSTWLAEKWPRKLGVVIDPAARQPVAIVTALFRYVSDVSCSTTNAATSALLIRRPFSDPASTRVEPVAG